MISVSGHGAMLPLPFFGSSWNARSARVVDVWVDDDVIGLFEGLRGCFGIESSRMEVFLRCSDTIMHE
jgi:hypothetical protein